MFLVQNCYKQCKKLMYKFHNLGIYSCKWITKIENMLSLCDITNLWYNQTTLNISYAAFKYLCKSQLNAYYNKYSENAKSCKALFIMYINKLILFTFS